MQLAKTVSWILIHPPSSTLSTKLLGSHPFLSLRYHNREYRNGPKPSPNELGKAHSEIRSNGPTHLPSQKMITFAWTSPVFNHLERVLLDVTRMPGWVPVLQSDGQRMGRAGSTAHHRQRGKWRPGRNTRPLAGGSRRRNERWVGSMGRRIREGQSMMGDLTRLGDIILRRYEDSLSSQYPSRHACTGVDQQGDEDGVSQGWLMRLNRQSPLRIRGKSRTLPFST